MNNQNRGLIRIGITGHQFLPNPELFQNALHSVFTKIESQFVEARFEFYSPLAPGADTLVARLALQLNIPLIIFLPSEECEYLDSFVAEHRSEYKQLAQKAQGIIHLPQQEGKNRYEVIEDYLVEQMDYLITLWDGEEARGPGGTGEVVERFLRTGKPCAWVYAENGLQKDNVKHESIRAQGSIQYIN
jgi:hypothetical protein